MLAVLTFVLMPVGLILGQTPQGAEMPINTVLPNSPHLYAGDEVTVACNGGYINGTLAERSELGLRFPNQGSSQDIRCDKTAKLERPFEYIPIGSLPVEPVKPDSHTDCRELYEDGHFQFVFKTHNVGLTYNCFLDDGATPRTERLSQSQTLPTIMHELPSDTQLETDGDNFYEGSIMTATCNVTGGFPVTTSYQYSFAGLTQNVTGVWTFSANRTMTGDITCTSTEHLLYRNRSQPGLVGSKTINIHYIDLTPEAQGVVKREFNPGKINSINCQHFYVTNLLASDVTYTWTNSDDTDVSTQSTLRLPTGEADGTVGYMCDITGRKFRTSDTEQTRRVVVEVTWSSIITASPTALPDVILPNASLPTYNIAGIVGIVVSVQVCLCAVIVILVCAKRRNKVCFKRSECVNSGAKKGGSSDCEAEPGNLIHPSDHSEDKSPVETNLDSDVRSDHRFI